MKSPITLDQLELIKSNLLLMKKHDDENRTINDSFGILPKRDFRWQLKYIDKRIQTMKTKL